MVCKRWCVKDGVCERWCVTKWCERWSRSCSSRKPYVLRLPHDRQPRASGDHALSSSSSRLCVLRLYHATGSRRPAATTRAPPPPGGSVYCACHTKASHSQRPPRAPQLRQKALCIVLLPHESQPRASSGHARRGSARRLCVVLLPHENQLRASGGHAPRTASRRPAAPTRTAAPPEGSACCPCHTKATRAAQPEGSVCCACHTKERRPRAPEGSAAAPATLSQPRPRPPATRKPTAKQRPRAPQPPEGSDESQPRPKRRPRAPQLREEALCAAPPEGSVRCACHTTSGDYARRSSARRLCVLRLPHESQPRPSGAKASCDELSMMSI